VAAAVTVPFFLWNPSAFVNSVVTLQFRQPFRRDALSFLAAWTVIGLPQPSVTIAFGMAGLVSALAVWRLPRTAAGFSAALAATLLAFFAFNKQAFCNYYFFVIGALCVTLAACTGSPQEVQVAQVSSPAQGTRLRPVTQAGWAALGALATAALVPLLWIGDVPFINDEPQDAVTVPISACCGWPAETRAARPGCSASAGGRCTGSAVWDFKSL